MVTNALRLAAIALTATLAPAMPATLGDHPVTIPTNPSVATQEPAAIANTAKSTTALRAMPMESLGRVGPESVNQAAKHLNRSLMEA